MSSPVIVCKNCYEIMILPIEEYIDGREFECPYCGFNIIIEDAETAKKLHDIIVNSYCPTTENCYKRAKTAEVLNGDK